MIIFPGTLLSVFHTEFHLIYNKTTSRGRYQCPTFFETCYLPAFLKTSCPSQINGHGFGSFCNHCLSYCPFMQSPNLPLLQLMTGMTITILEICPTVIMNLQKSIPSSLGGTEDKSSSRLEGNFF